VIGNILYAVYVRDNKNQSKEFLKRLVNSLLQASTPASSRVPNPSSIINMSHFGIEDTLTRATLNAMDVIVFSMPLQSSMIRLESP